MTGAGEQLTRGAELLREKATAADLDSFGSWHGIGTGYRFPIREHIAAMTPTFALAVADLLDTISGANNDEDIVRTERAALDVVRIFCEVAS